jgi:hypothetical protein
LALLPSESRHRVCVVVTIVAELACTLLHAQAAPGALG